MVAAYPTTGSTPWQTTLKNYLNELKGIWSVTDYGGAIGNGTADDTTAIANTLSAAAAGGGAVYFPPGTYKVTSTLTVSCPVFSNGATILVGGSTFATLVTIGASGVEIQGLTFSDATGLISAYLINDGGFSNFEVTDCQFATTTAVSVRVSSAQDVKILDNRFIGVYIGVQLEGPCADVWVERNRIDGWQQYGIYAVGSGSGAASRVKLRDNNIINMTAGGPTRYPIHTAKNTSPTNFLDWTIAGNTIIGPDKAYTAAVPGTADNMGMFAVTRLAIVGNESSGGGDMGITVDGICTDVTIIGNTCERNDTAGIAVSGSCRDVTISGNTLKNNGQNRNSDRITSRVGVWVNTSTNILIAGNNFADDGGATQQYGVYATTATGLTFSGNRYHGMTIGRFNNGASNTSVEHDTVLVATKPADTTRNNVGTVASDPDLALAVEANAVYTLEMFLLYSASTTGKVQVHLTGPASFVADWTMDALISTTTTTSNSLNRAQLNAAATNTLGGAGVGTKVIALPTGRIATSTTAGTLTLQWSQAVAEVSDAVLYAGSYFRLTRIA